MHVILVGIIIEIHEDELPIHLGEEVLLVDENNLIFKK
jgi:hypothetical protein